MTSSLGIQQAVRPDLPEVPPEVQKIEVQLLMQAISMRYGYDFSQYRPGTILNAFLTHVHANGYRRISDLIPAVLSDRKAFDSLFLDISVGTTEMFRNPETYQKMRTAIIPLLKTYPYLNIWHAGCATGEEAYSMAIFLKEEGLYNRAHIYATDINGYSLRHASHGIYPLKDMQRNTHNYNAAGCINSLGDYYRTKYKAAKMNSDLKKNITFSNHNLVTDSVFSETQLVVCKNVLIYFNQDLQNKVLKLLTNSLCRNGFLCIGEHESLELTAVRDQYELVDSRARIYRKKITISHSDE
ncbi:MAG: protein-glutamate O-methyltransferase CheR [Pseudohongiellaceae bacterium]